MPKAGAYVVRKSVQQEVVVHQLVHNWCTSGARTSQQVGKGAQGTCLASTLGHIGGATLLMQTSHSRVACIHKPYLCGVANTEAISGQCAYAWQPRPTAADEISKHMVGMSTLCFKHSFSFNM